MKRSNFIAAAIVALAGAMPAFGQGVGTKLGAVELQGFAQTEAHTFDNFLGDVVLFEFFAYW